MTAASTADSPVNARGSWLVDGLPHPHHQRQTCSAPLAAERRSAGSFLTATHTYRAMSDSTNLEDTDLETRIRRLEKRVLPGKQPGPELFTDLPTHDHEGEPLRPGSLEDVGTLVNSAILEASDVDLREEHGFVGVSQMGGATDGTWDTDTQTWPTVHYDAAFADTPNTIIGGANKGVGVTYGTFNQSTTSFRVQVTNYTSGATSSNNFSWISVGPA